MATIVRWNPVREMATMQREMDRFMDATWRGLRAANLATLALDVHETETGYTVTAAVPGVAQDDVHVTLDENVLTISGETANVGETKEGTGRALLLERTYGKFSRSIRLPRPVAAEKIEAVLHNGVLTLTLPLSADAQPKTIPVRMNGVVTTEPSVN